MSAFLEHGLHGSHLGPKTPETNENNCVCVCVSFLLMLAVMKCIVGLSE